MIRDYYQENIFHGQTVIVPSYFGFCKEETNFFTRKNQIHSGFVKTEVITRLLTANN